MGFILSDLDFQRLSPEERVALWNTLPLKTGVVAPPRPPAPAATPRGAVESAPVRSPAAPSAARIEGTPSPKERIPTAAEQKARQKAFLENLGRFLASL